MCLKGGNSVLYTSLPEIPWRKLPSRPEVFWSLGRASAWVSLGLGRRRESRNDTLREGGGEGRINHGHSLHAYCVPSKVCELGTRSGKRVDLAVPLQDLV